MGNAGSKTEEESESSRATHEQSDTTNVEISTKSADPGPSNESERLIASHGHTRDVLSYTSASSIIRAGGLSNNSTEQAMIHMSAGILAFGQNCHQACNAVVEALKKFDIKTFALAVMEWIKRNPGKTAMFVACIVTPVLLAAATPLFLGVIGFTGTGVAAGSIAAIIQASIGNVAAGSLFAILQSAAMGGAAAPVVGGVVWVASSVIGWGFGIRAWFKEKAREREHNRRQAETAIVRRN